MAKRLLSLFLALVTVFSMAATAFAEGADASEEPILVEMEELDPAELEDLDLSAAEEDPADVPEEPEAEPETPEEASEESHEISSEAKTYYLPSESFTSLLDPGSGAIPVGFSSGIKKMAPSVRASLSPAEETAYVVRGESPEPYLAYYYGTCGKNLTWYLFDDGELIIDGTGAMYNYDFGTAPWFNTSGLIDIITIYGGVTSIGDFAFAGLESVSDIRVATSSSLKSIGTWAFFDTFYPYGIDTFTLPGTVTKLSEAALAGVFVSAFKVGSGAASKKFKAKDGILYNASLTELIQYPPLKTASSYKVPSTVTKIGTLALYPCAYLSSIQLPDGLTSISQLAFSSAGISEIKIPASVKTIGGGAFMYCDYLYDITIQNAYCTIEDSPTLFDSPGETLGSPYYTTVHGYKSSSAQTYAKKYGYSFSSLGKAAAPKMKSAANTTKGLKISWKKVTGATNYRIYYKTSEKGSWKKLKDVGDVSSYTFKTAKSGTKYWFSVAAMSSDKKTISDYGSSVKSVTYLATPQMASVAKTSKGIKISWEKVSGAAKYRIYYKTSENGSWKKLKDVGKVDSYTFKTAKSGTKYWFTVRAMTSTKKTLSGYGSSVMNINFKK